MLMVYKEDINIQDEKGKNYFIEILSIKLNYQTFFPSYEYLSLGRTPLVRAGGDFQLLLKIQQAGGIYYIGKCRGNVTDIELLILMVFKNLKIYNNIEI